METLNYLDNELTENVTIRNFRMVQNEDDRKVSRDHIPMTMAEWEKRMNGFLKLMKILPPRSH